MPVYNITVSNISPLIVYQGAWSDSSHTDPDWIDHANGTYHSTNANNASASLSFNGSAVYVVGAKRPNHGDYSVNLDGDTSLYNGYEAQDTFNLTLFSQSELGNLEHDFVVQNMWSGTSETYLGVDYIIISAGDGDNSTTSSNVILDDGHANITYSDNQWTLSPDDLKIDCYNQTMHRTNDFGAWASILFYGNAIFLYGSTASDHGLFTVVVDGITAPAHFSGSAPVNYTRWQNLLYYTGGLSTEMHNLTVINTDPNEPALWFDLDKIVVSTWQSMDPSGTVIQSSSAPVVGGGTSPGMPTPSVVHGEESGLSIPVESRSTLSSGAAAAIIALVVCITVSLAVVLFLFCRNTKRSFLRPLMFGKKKAAPRLVVEPFMTNVSSRRRSASVVLPAVAKDVVQRTLDSAPAEMTVSSAHANPVPWSSATSRSECFSTACTAGKTVDIEEARNRDVSPISDEKAKWYWEQIFRR